MSVKNFGEQFTVVFPQELGNQLSDTSIAEDVFIGYKFCAQLQKFMLDYAYKVNSGIPLSDEVIYDNV